MPYLTLMNVIVVSKAHPWVTEKMRLISPLIWWIDLS